MSLRAKLVLFIVGTVALVQMAWGLSVVRSDAHTMEQEALRRGREILRALSVPSAFHLANRQVETLDALLASYDRSQGRDIDFLWISVVDTNGKIMAHTDPREFGKQSSDPFSSRAIRSERPLEQIRKADNGRISRISMPVVSGLRWGTIQAELSLSRLDERIAQTQWVVLVTSSVIAVCTAVLLGALLRNLVFLPLGALSTAAQRISQGELGARVTEREVADELAVVGQSFNQMADRVQQHTVELEAQVASRTRELRSTNAALEQANEDLGRAVDELERLASTDGLTGVRNHRSFQEAMHNEILRSSRTKQPITTLMIDVDHFKAYNDTHGHPAGDRVLIQVTRILQRNLRNTDLIARYGGEEFSVILIDTPVTAGMAVAEKLRNAVHKTAFPGARKSQPSGRITISVGLASFPDHATTSAELIGFADKALYAAKHAGRDQVQAYCAKKT
jgi:diguanylate cyclase (GGDEF)-like protein